MKPVYIGVPVLRRYDLLRALLLSCECSIQRPELVVIVDNGKKPHLLDMKGLSFPIEVYEPETPLGVAASWNWLIGRLPEERIITNDDITFSPDSIEVMAGTPGDLVFGYGFSCYLIRDMALAKVGTFDEDISPGYAYWEDIDYEMRIRLAIDKGVDFVQVNAPTTVAHLGSQTNRWATPEEIQQHHRKFELAKSNFRKKYAHLSDSMQHPALGLMSRRQA